VVRACVSKDGPAVLGCGIGPRDHGFSPASLVVGVAGLWNTGVAVIAGARLSSSVELATWSTGAVPGTGGLRGGVASEPDAMLADGAGFTDAADAVFSDSSGGLDMRTSGGL
jgi:hypothetical protein